MVFAVWTALGFAFPAEPLPLALNIISKVLCFVAAIMLFVEGCLRALANFRAGQRYRTAPGLAIE